MTTVTRLHHCSEKKIHVRLACILLFIITTKKNAETLIIKITYQEQA